jgi:putative glutamine amidotransferase
MKRFVVGVLPHYYTDNPRELHIWMRPDCTEAIMSNGGVPFMLPLIEDVEAIRQVMDMCDGFLFTGGQDVDPAIYGEETMPECGAISHERDNLEKIVLNEVLKTDKPVLAICRGCQVINALMGGTLYQDIPTQRPSELEHHQKKSKLLPIHDVDIVKDSPLYDVIGQERIAVNSFHHQGIKELAPCFTTMATATDGLVESYYLKDKPFFWAVQWHPEFSFSADENSKKIFGAFLKAFNK